MRPRGTARGAGVERAVEEDSLELEELENTDDEPAACGSSSPRGRAVSSAVDTGVKERDALDEELEDSDKQSDNEQGTNGWAGCVASRWGGEAKLAGKARSHAK